LVDCAVPKVASHNKSQQEAFRRSETAGV
jgi:hypothetical protein